MSCCGQQMQGMFGLSDDSMLPNTGGGIVGTPPGNPGGGFGANTPGQTGSTAGNPNDNLYWKRFSLIQPGRKKTTSGTYMNTGEPIDPDIETHDFSADADLTNYNDKTATYHDQRGAVATYRDPVWLTNNNFAAFWDKYKWWIIGGGCLVIGGVTYAVVK